MFSLLRNLFIAVFVLTVVVITVRDLGGGSDENTSGQTARYRDGR